MQGASFQGKVAVVTGGGSGIGCATAIAFAAASARVAVCDIDTRGGTETVEKIQAIGGDALFIAVDVSSAVAVESMVDRTVAVFDRLDFAFNNAGILLEDSLRDSGSSAGWEEAVFERTWRINAGGVMHCMKYEIRQMLKQGSGAIVNTSSVEGFRGVAGHLSYSASKHAVLGLTRSAAMEYGRSGIRINAVCPGVIRTPMINSALETIGDERLAAYHPLGRIGQPEEVAEAVLWLCSEGASFITGHGLPVDGGMLSG